ncbi:MAG: FkbM family methyltransferase [Chloroflexota bacterium]
MIPKLKSHMQHFVADRKFRTLDIDLQVVKKRFGSAYGGWDVAIECLYSDAVVYSAGVGLDASFDLELMAQFDLSVYAFDPTPQSISWVESADFGPSFRFYPYGIAAFDGKALFNPPRDPAHVSHTILQRESTSHLGFAAPFKRIKTIMSDLGHQRIDLLKLDIEGAEIDVVTDMLKTAVYPAQLLIEFHHQFPNVGIESTLRAIESLKSAGYKLFAISEHRTEFSFILNG